MNLAHARALIAEWRRDYNDERPKKDLGGIPPAVYAARLSSLANPNAKESSTVCNE
jgi:transposase InsO family protein